MVGVNRRSIIENELALHSLPRGCQLDDILDPCFFQKDGPQCANLTSRVVEICKMNINLHKPGANLALQIRKDEVALEYVIV